jgi:hypothetical protein
MPSETAVQARLARAAPGQVRVEWTARLRVDGRVRMLDGQLEAAMDPACAETQLLGARPTLRDTRSELFPPGKPPASLELDPDEAFALADAFETQGLASGPDPSRLFEILQAKSALPRDCARLVLFSSDNREFQARIVDMAGQTLAQQREGVVYNRWARYAFPVYAMALFADFPLCFFTRCF